MSKRKTKHDQNLRAITAQLLTLGVILLIIACVLLGWDISNHVVHVRQQTDKTAVNIKVSTSCVSSPPAWPVVTGNG